MPRAIWNGRVVAESDTVEMVEGNVCFPPAAVRRAFFRDSPAAIVCPWKGTARYYTLVVNGAVNQDAAWSYPDPKPGARTIKDHVAFWKRVAVED